MGPISFCPHILSEHGLCKTHIFYQTMEKIPPTTRWFCPRLSHKIQAITQRCTQIEGSPWNMNLWLPLSLVMVVGSEYSTTASSIFYGLGSYEIPLLCARPIILIKYGRFELPISSIFCFTNSNQLCVRLKGRTRWSNYSHLKQIIATLNSSWQFPIGFGHHPTMKGGERGINDIFQQGVTL